LYSSVVFSKVDEERKEDADSKEEGEATLQEKTEGAFQAK